VITVHQFYGRADGLKYGWMDGWMDDLIDELPVEKRHLSKLGFNAGLN